MSNNNLPDQIWIDETDLKQLHATLHKVVAAVTEDPAPFEVSYTRTDLHDSLLDIVSAKEKEIAALYEQLAAVQNERLLDALRDLATRGQKEIDRLEKAAALYAAQQNLLPAAQGCRGKAQALRPFVVELQNLTGSPGPLLKR